MYWTHLCLQNCKNNLFSSAVSLPSLFELSHASNITKSHQKKVHMEKSVRLWKPIGKSVDPTNEYKNNKNALQQQCTVLIAFYGPSAWNCEWMRMGFLLSHSQWELAKPRNRNGFFCVTFDTAKTQKHFLNIE